MFLFVFQRREYRCPRGDCHIWWGAVEEDKYIEFNVRGRVDDEQNYIAVAFSKDGEMVIGCLIHEIIYLSNYSRDIPIKTNNSTTG